MPLTDCKSVWKNCKIVPWAETTFCVSGHDLHYGTGVFEGMRCYSTPSGPAVFRLGTHIDRWFASARVYGLAWPYSRQDLAHAVLEVIRAKQFRACYIRPIAFYGTHTLGIHPKGCPTELSILAWPWDLYRNRCSSERRRCLHLAMAEFSIHAVPASAMACGQYLNSVPATQDAVARGFDEALLLDEAGNLTEGPAENLFLVGGKRLFTNDQESSILLGIARDTVIHLANDLGIGTFVQKLTLADLRAAEEAFLTDTAAEITPVATVVMNLIGNGIPGRVTTMLQNAYQKAVSGRKLAIQRLVDPCHAALRTKGPERRATGERKEPRNKWRPRLCKPVCSTSSKSASDLRVHTPSVPCEPPVVLCENSRSRRC
jgi:branched-chain amino acid aminotransferase